MGGYWETEAQIQARWERWCKRAEEIAKQKEQEQSDAIRRAAAAEG